MSEISFPIRRHCNWNVGAPTAPDAGPPPPKRTHLEIISGDRARFETGRPDPVARIVTTDAGEVGWLTERDLEQALEHVRRLKG